MIEYKVAKENDSNLAVKIEKGIRQYANCGLMFPWPQQEIFRAMRAKNLVIAMENELMVGHAFLNVWETKYLEVCGVVVYPSYRRQGIATKLVKKLVDTALKNYEGQNRSIVFLGNNTSIPIALKAGFVMTQKEKLDPTLWRDCNQCAEWDIFPNCHCLPLIYPEG